MEIEFFFGLDYIFLISIKKTLFTCLGRQVQSSHECQGRDTSRSNGVPFSSIDFAEYEIPLKTCLKLNKVLVLKYQVEEWVWYFKLLTCGRASKYASKKFEIGFRHKSMLDITSSSSSSSSPAHHAI